jgi:hypothetical protein
MPPQSIAKGFSSCSLYYQGNRGWNALFSPQFAWDADPLRDPCPFFLLPKQASIDETPSRPYFPRHIARHASRRARTAGVSPYESPQFLEIAAKSAPQQPAGAASGPGLCDQ